MKLPPDLPTNCAKPNLKNFAPGQVEAFIAHLGKERYRARQLLKAIYREGKRDFASITTLARDFREHLAEIACIDSITLADVCVGRDGTRKILWRLSDGLTIETVLIPGNNHWTICVSTQAGCRMGCAFCHTGKNGFRRNLTPGEITDQITLARLAFPEVPLPRNCVLMGMGEPLDNYENTLTALSIITNDYGLGFSPRRVTLSTCGLPDGIQRLGEDSSVHLAISLNAADDATRNILMPINRVHPLKDLLSACSRYPLPGGRMLTFEYILIAGVNSSREDARKLTRLLKNLRCKLNLIPFNPFPASPYQPPSWDEVLAFQQVLIAHHFTAIIRKSHGEDILAACGQLSGQFNGGVK